MFFGVTRMTEQTTVYVSLASRLGQLTIDGRLDLLQEFLALLAARQDESAPCRSAPGEPGPTCEEAVP